MPSVQRATQSSYCKLLEERRLRPLGMHNTSVGVEYFFAAENRAIPHGSTATGP